MPKFCYVPKNFDRKTLVIIAAANAILEEYAAQGFTLTIRQLYYQYVSLGYMENTKQNYKKLGAILGDARLAGLVDWDHLEDRTRNLASLQHFSSGQDALTKLHGWYHINMWDRQKYRPVVFVEKDALTGVIQGVCQENDVPYFSCRGYTSLSEMYVASQRFHQYLEDGHTPYIIHFGDHDPSGVDMSRDIVERLQNTFMADCDFKRVALNMDQIEEYKPVPNFAKTTDSRYQAYISKYGQESWELDALKPPVFRSIIEKEIAGIRDDKVWKEDAAEKEQVKKKLLEISQEWETISANKVLLKRSEKSLRLANEEITSLKTQVESLQKKKRNRKGKPDA